MADYIYLMQNRLTAAQWRALEAVREAARAHNMPVFLVGGAVRDLTSGAPVRDLDFAVQGEASALVSDLESRGASVSGKHPVLSSLYFTFRGGVRAEIAPTLSVSYPKPGQPEARTAAILDDLRRRDFTANAMAVSLNEGSYGLLLDPLNGTADIENRELRLVSPYGFIEQPAILLRAARLSDRLGWTLEERTQGRYETSKEEAHIKALPAWDLGYELEELFHEEDPLAALEHMETEGWREILFAALNGEGADRGGLDEVRDLIGQLESQRIYPDPSAVLFPLITAKLGEETRLSLKKLFARQGFVRQIDTLEARSKDLANLLTAKATPLPSDAWKLLMDADPEVVLWLAHHSRSAAVQSRIKAFLKDWPQMRQKIPYALMQEMRITPDLPSYEGLLDDLFFALIDGKLDTAEATRAFLEPFSPPAPPQVSVRRRPAKSARGRGKRAAEPVVSDPEEADENDDADEQEADDPVPELRLPAPRPIDPVEDESDPTDDVDEDASVPVAAAATKSEEAEPTPAPVPVASEQPSVAISLAAEREPEPAATSKRASHAAKAPVRTAATPAAPAKRVIVVKAAPAKSSATKKGGVAATPHATSKSVSKGASPIKTSPKAVSKPKPGAKIATTKKALSKAPAKAAKAPAKKSTQAKTVPVKAAATTKSLKVALKKTPAVKGRAAVPKPQTAPAKPAKKQAAKGRGRK